MSGFSTLTGCFSTGKVIGQGACSGSFLEWAVFLDNKKMVKYCSAYDCYSYCGTSGLSFHRIPKDVVRRKQWISALKLKRQLKWDCVWICSDHFTPDSYENTPLTDKAVFRKKICHSTIIQIVKTILPSKVTFKSSIDPDEKF